MSDSKSERRKVLMSGTSMNQNTTESRSNPPKNS